MVAQQPVSRGIVPRPGNGDPLAAIGPALQAEPLPPIPAASPSAAAPPGYAELATPGGAQPTPGATSAALMLPERASGIWRITTNLDLFLPIGSIGIGGLLDASVTRHFEGPFLLRAQIAPLGFAFVNSGGGSAFATHLVFGLDTQFLELALGAGSSTTDGFTSSFSLLQSLRIGALDGLHLAFQTNVVIVDDQFQLGAVNGDIQVPLLERWWLLMRGGGGPAGYVFGDVGVRYRVKGNGGAGSFFLSGMIGGVALVGATRCSEFSCDSASSGGPALGVGLEWRL